MALSNTDLIEVERGGVLHQATGAQLNDYITPVYNTWDPASMAANAYTVSDSDKRVKLNAKTRNHKWYTIKTTIPIPNTGKWGCEFIFNKSIDNFGITQADADNGRDAGFLGICEKSNAAHPTTTSWYVSKNSSSISNGQGSMRFAANSRGQYDRPTSNFSTYPWGQGARYFIGADMDANKLVAYYCTSPTFITTPDTPTPGIRTLNLDPNKEYVFALSAQDSTYNGASNLMCDVSINSHEDDWWLSQHNYFQGHNWKGLHNRL